MYNFPLPETRSTFATRRVLAIKPKNHRCTGFETGYQCSASLSITQCRIHLSHLPLPLNSVKPLRAASGCASVFQSLMCGYLSQLLQLHTQRHILPPRSLNLSPVLGIGFSALKHHSRRSSNGKRAKKTPLQRYANPATTQAINASIQ